MFQSSGSLQEKLWIIDISALESRGANFLWPFFCLEIFLVLFSGDFLFLALLKHLLGIFFLGFLSKSKFDGTLRVLLHLLRRCQLGFLGG